MMKKIPQRARSYFFFEGGLGGANSNVGTGALSLNSTLGWGVLGLTEAGLLGLFLSD